MQAVPGGSKKTRRLGDILVDKGLITPDDLERALLEQSRTDQLLGRILIDLRLVKESDLLAALAEQVGFRFVELSEDVIDPSAAMLVPEQVARRHRAIPIAYEDGKLVVAMADPANLIALDDFQIITGMAVKPVVAPAAEIERAIRKYSRLEQSVQDVAIEASTSAAQTDQDEEDRSGSPTQEGPIVRMVNLLITQAITDRASDIHVEPTDRDVRIRYRVDGVLHEVMRSPKNIQGRLISRLKVMADIDIGKSQIPQGGRVRLKVAGKVVDLRMATLPTAHGEEVVIRILDKSAALLKLDELGLLEEGYQRFQQAFAKPYGGILVTGPTGSGKSTTLYGTLSMLNKVDRKIVTIEDPIEYGLAGIAQMQVNPRAGLTFASALRSILRADPDVIMVGEIRDRETAVIAIEAALTGHLVLSTLHTNDAPSSLPRMVEMGVEPYLVASAIDCVVAQRLARKLCTRCKAGYKPDRAELARAGLPEATWDEVSDLFRPVGCTACAKTGYAGRIGLYEVMPITEEIERLVVDRASSEEIRRCARRDGMIILREDGLEKVRLGVTSIQEVLRVVS